MIVTQHLTRTYTMNDRTVAALEDVSFHVSPGEYAAIVGPSGSGKSTLMHTLSGLDSVTSGHIMFQGVDLFLTPVNK